MMALLLSDGPRSPQLRSSKSFLANSSSHEVSGNMSSSSEERSTTRILSKGPPCSYVGNNGQGDETSGGEPGGCGDIDGDNNNVEALPNEEEDPLTGEHERLVPLLFSIVNKWRRERKTLEEKWSSFGWVATQDERSIYSS
jgi:hypothetical protein